MKLESHSYWVIITVKNGESVIKKTLDSIISQSLKPSLVCIINDGSTDSTLDILSEIKKENSQRIFPRPLPEIRIGVFCSSADPRYFKIEH